MVWREEIVEFHKKVKKTDDKEDKETINIVHKARIITYVNMKNAKRPKVMRLLTNDFDMKYEDIVAIYDARWDIELLFRQLKQNFPLRYFYGESANAIKIQIWVTLIANLLQMLLQKKHNSFMELLWIGYHR